jgi:hypothetical protein
VSPRGTGRTEAALSAKEAQEPRERPSILASFPNGGPEVLGLRDTPSRHSTVSNPASRAARKLIAGTPRSDSAMLIKDMLMRSPVVTAMEFQSEGAAIRWTVVSIPEEFPHMSEGATKEREAPAKQTALSVPSPDQPNAALNRIEIPQDTVERISELLTPASSLIISDNGFSHETGKDTDFIVVTH